MVKEKHQYEKTQKRMGFNGFKQHQPERFNKPSKAELVKRLKEIAKKRAK
jgi:hypothetical protein|tara:strand:- start:518 stop:667 length:150 start_codon:yes stop_codon:yes gene_type:complete